MSAQLVTKASERAIGFSTLGDVRLLNLLRGWASPCRTSAFQIKATGRHTVCSLPKSRCLRDLDAKNHVLVQLCWLQNWLACKGWQHAPSFLVLPPCLKFYAFKRKCTQLTVSTQYENLGKCTHQGCCWLSYHLCSTSWHQAEMWVFKNTDRISFPSFQATKVV